ncbi:hypothetical protein WHYPHY_1 [Bacillus phage WhyPhy]|uniref:Uncharacterized protein n=1 Tax=Bacillus phage WhyPhy TaxID=2801480 RepID=A0A7T7ZAK2_9CAUD|nr:hypothetical protein KNV75_gp01 [Bacillus phage WhyPhy]QQO40344.1 hypothetical protein WHYPHY_1 [Bacillus phage WhyPhy]
MKLIISSDLIQIIIAVIVLQSMSIVFAGFLLIRMTAVIYRFKQTFDEGIQVKQTFDQVNENFVNEFVNSTYPKHYKKDWRKI